MNENTLTREKILEAAEEVLRRFGPSKATVVDVARALGVSHGSVYRHFASKAELRDAVLDVWLTRVTDPLEAIVAQDAPAAERLYHWLRELIAMKRHRLADDPELTAAYLELVTEAGEAVEAHRAHLTEQIRRIVADGAAQGEFHAEDPAATARAVLSATSRFHHPAHQLEWAHPAIDADFEAVWTLILSGLTARAGRTGSESP